MTKNGTNYDTGREYADIAAEATAQNRTMHFGELMRLCYVKHSELEASLRSYKGRVEFRGDNVRDASGFLAVFS